MLYITLMGSAEVSVVEIFQHQFLHVMGPCSRDMRLEFSGIFYIYLLLIIHVLFIPFLIRMVTRLPSSPF